MKIYCVITYLLIILMIAACSTSQSRYVPLVSEQPPKPEDYPIQIFHNDLPYRQFEQISRIDVHLGKTHFISSGFEDALPKLQKEARLLGADADIDIKETSRLLVRHKSIM